MSSAVFFKFKSQKEPQRVTFDGTGISVFELKRDIISISRLGDGTDFDLAIYNPDSNEEYDDDTTIISRGTTVVARRLPAVKPGAGRAARYVSGKMPVTAKNQHRIEASRISAVKDTRAPTASLSTNASEEDRIAAMFNQGGEQWEQQQAQMANQKAIHRTGYVKPQAVPDKPLPVGYTCHRCGEKGHWIQACPTNNDPTFDNRPKFKKTTGIPRSFLKVVDKPPGLASDGTVDVSQLPAGVMYTNEGEWVVAEPDKASWEQFQAKTKAAAEKMDASANNDDLEKWGIECPIDKRMFVDPVKTPCCGKTYCRECIENALFNSDFTCPGCSTEGVLVDNLIDDGDAIKKMKEYAEFKQKAAAAKSATPEPAPADPASAAQETSSGPSAESAGDKGRASKSPSVKSVTPATDGAAAKPEPPKGPKADSKKRGAEDELENKRIPTGPAAMRRQQPAFNPQQGGNINDFAQQMNAMAANMGFNQQAFMNGMGFNGINPMAMGMNPMMNMGFQGMGFPQMNNGGFYNNNFNQQWQGNGQGRGNNRFNQQHQNGKPPTGPGQNRNRNQQQRDVDYRELGS